MSNKRLESIRKSVIEQARGEVLEIGIGAGHNIPLYKNISKLYALEPSEELLVLAKTKLAHVPIEFVRAGAEQIPLPNHSLDTVISTWTLCSVEAPEIVLAEVKRVLRPDGQFLFVDHGVSPHLLSQALQNILTPITKRTSGNCHLNRDIEKLITDAGFKILDMEHPTMGFKLLAYNYQGLANT